MHISSLLAAIAFVASTVSSLSTACKSGEVAVGTNQLCSIGNPNSGGSCGFVAPSIFANDCGLIASSGKSNQCDASGWNRGASIQCHAADGTPWIVNTQGGRFGNCYKANSNCSAGPLQHWYASYCCSRI
ncbi:hypothetical protein QQZ08_010044 [Neonectria magnoliae]|uniref:Cyanovirin-N domain-containing protein n=1 Tax=Neonectria magnoliae TaxID=2732573 RepID=A0ABR1HJV1_9HYPO